MPNGFRKPSGARIALLLAGTVLLSPLLIPRSVLPWGFNIFYFWAGLCVAAILANRIFLWAGLCSSALIFVSIGWWLRGGPPPVNPYGFGPIDAIALFSGTALVIAATGVLGVTLTAPRTKRDDAPTRPPSP